MERGSIRSDRIKQLREQRKLDQATVAYRAGVDVSYVYRLEQGHNPNVSALILAAIARALRTNTDYLVGASDDPTPSVEVVSEELSRYEPLSSAALELAVRLNELSDEERDWVKSVIDVMLEVLGREDQALVSGPPRTREEFEDWLDTLSDEELESLAELASSQEIMRKRRRTM